MMSRRILYTIILGAMLAMAANLMPSSYAQAMGTECRCPTGECSCCCAQNKAEEPASVFQSLGRSASESCTCSSGPNPFSVKDSAAVTVSVDPTQKHVFQSSVVLPAGLSPTPAGLPEKRHKPPAVSPQSLYLLNNSLRI
jgi:hypothetical protein